MGLQQASAEIAAGHAGYLQRRRAEQELRRPIDAIDGLIRELEELQVRGQRRVPLSYGQRLQDIAQMVRRLSPGGCTRDAFANLRVKIGIVKLMDALYTLEACVFAHRAQTLGLELIPEFS